MVDGYDNYGTITGVENVTGSELADEIRGDHNNNVLLGASGDDLIVGHGGNDIVDGGDGSDVLRGDAQNYINGPFGNDTLIGGAGGDLMRGSAGIDSYDGGSDSGAIGIYGGFGDRISFYEVAATAGVIADLRTGIISNDGFGNVETMAGIESLGGDTAFVDTFYGNDDRNTLLGGRGDNLFGFGGDDQFSLSAAAAVVDGGDGIDVLQLNDAGGWLTASPRPRQRQARAGRSTSPPARSPTATATRAASAASRMSMEANTATCLPAMATTMS
jgi:Ca2+-binding RTX toxin-like protein